jgi:hypothetical protein
VKTANGPEQGTGARRRVELRPVDVLMVVSCTGAALLLLGPYRWAPGAGTSALVYLGFALGPLVLRWLESLYPQRRLLAFVACFWLLPVTSIGHEFLSPLVTGFFPGLRDAQLASLDQRLFGVQVSVWLGQLVPPWLTEVLLVCYYGHFVWPVVLGLVLYFTGRREAFDEYLLALGLFMVCNFVLYAWVPAIGPRYFLVDAFSRPLRGLWLTPYLDSAMRQPLFIRDCFPSGHTGVTLLVMLYAWRFERRVLRVMCLPGLGLIAATLVGRFHYATDLLCAPPLVLCTTAVALAWSRHTGRRPSVARPVPMDAIVRS